MVSQGIGSAIYPYVEAVGSTAYHAFALSVAIQADGKIILAGGAYNEGTGGTGVDYAVARYNVDGSLDTSFSGDGLLTTDFGGNESASSMAIQADGKIVVTGEVHDAFGVARYNVDGSLDTSFSDDGLLTTDFVDCSDCCANSVAVQANGRIIVAGYGYWAEMEGYWSLIALVRYWA